MMLNITEEQGVNGAFNLITQGISAGTRFHSWLERKKEKEKREAEYQEKQAEIQAKKDAVEAELQAKKDAMEIRSDACSYYRNGYVQNPNEGSLIRLANDLRGTEFTRADGNFIFLGDKSDLSYFWKKNEANENIILPRSCIESIEDKSIKRGTISALTQAKEKGFLTFDGEAYVLTAKGKEAVLDPGFIANRLKAEEVFFEKAWQGLKESSQKLYVFEEVGKDPTEYYHIGNIKGADGNDFMKLVNEDKQELILPNDAKGKIAFESKEAGAEFVKENPDKVKDLQEYVRVYNAEKEKELYPTEDYANAYVESENGYLITLNNGEQLELPKEDVVKLENGSIKADIYYDKQYTLHIKDQKTTLSGAGVKEQLSKNATKATAEAAKATVSTVSNTTVNAADAAATAFPPAKAVTSTVNVVYKIAQGASSAASTVGGASQKL